MKNLDNYQVLEMSSGEMKETQGGFLCFAIFVTCFLITLLAGGGKNEE